MPPGNMPGSGWGTLRLTRRWAVRKSGMSDTKQMQERLEYHFTDSGLLKQALTHRSFGPHNNERLEYLGDSLLNLYVAERLYRQFPDLHEGDLTGMRAGLVCRESLAALARSLDLHTCLRMGKGEFKAGGQHRDSILSNAFEAVVGAIYLDSDQIRTWQVLGRLFDRLLKRTGTRVQKGPKSLLQEFLQQSGRPLPRYRLTGRAGKSHEPEFTIGCLVKGCDREFFARGKTRKQAEYRAAEKALEYLRQS